MRASVECADAGIDVGVGLDRFRGQEPEHVTERAHADSVAVFHPKARQAKSKSRLARYDEMAANLQLLLARREQLGRVITHTFPVERIDEAFATFLAGESGKVVVTQEGA